MTVKELIEELSKHDPDAKVIGYDNIFHKDFAIHYVTSDKVVDIGTNDGFQKTYGLQRFFVNGISVCDREPLGQNFVVLW